MTFEEVKERLKGMSEAERREVFNAPGGVFSQFIRPDLIPPRGWASTDDCGERREPAAIDNTTGGQSCLLTRGKSWLYTSGANEDDRRLVRDLVQAHNAYFCTDPEGDAKLDRELGQALKADAEKRARRAAVAICDALGPKPPSMIVLDLVASLILECQR